MVQRYLLSSGSHVVSYLHLHGPLGHVRARQILNILHELFSVFKDGLDVLHFEGPVLMPRKILCCERNAADIATIDLGAS